MNAESENQGLTSTISSDTMNSNLILQNFQSVELVSKRRFPTPHLESNDCKHRLFMDTDRAGKWERMVCLYCGRHSYVDGTVIRRG